MLLLNGLVDSSISALLAISPSPYVVSVLAQSRPLQAGSIYAINQPNYRKGFPTDKLKYLPQLTWNSVTRLVSPTRKDLLTEELVRRSMLAVKKCTAMTEVIAELSTARFWLGCGIPLQETVYMTKRMEAQRYKDAGYPPEGDLSGYPNLLLYAEFANLPLQVAADEILFQAQLADDYLAKTELLRLKYFKLIRDAEQIRDLESILEKFRFETYRKVDI